MHNEQLIEELMRSSVLRAPAIRDAFLHVDRKHFVPAVYQDAAYLDAPLPIGHEATISQPTTVAFMLELLEAKRGEKILDIGAGSGWTTALLAHIVGDTGSVTGVELVPELVEQGNANLSRFPFTHAEIRPAGKQYGIPGRQFDKILVSAAAQQLPPELVAQLRLGGRMVIPIRDSIWVIDRTSESEYTEQEYKGFAFVPLRGRDAVAV